MTTPECSVSFLICTYNRALLAEQAVKLLLNSGLPNIEVIVRDNASSDQTETLLSKINDSRYRYFRADSNQGTLNFLEIGKLSKGKIITWLSDEDDFNFEHLESILHTFENPGCNVLISSVITGKKSAKVIFKDEIISNPVAARLTTLRFSGLAGVFIRGEVFRKACNLQMNDAVEAYKTWNYYPIGYFATSCLGSSLYTSSKIVAIQSRYGPTTNNWSDTGNKTNLLPHYYPMSIYDRINSDLHTICQTNIKLTHMVKIIFYRICDFTNQLKNVTWGPFMELLKENYSEHQIAAYEANLKFHKLFSAYTRKFYIKQMTINLLIKSLKSIIVSISSNKRYTKET